MGISTYSPCVLICLELLLINMIESCAFVTKDY